ncbi:hypothetical protein MBLNU457_1603t1 [Dothideomycetes sp. NU457]
MSSVVLGLPPASQNEADDDLRTNPVTRLENTVEVPGPKLEAAARLDMARLRAAATPTNKPALLINGGKKKEEQTPTLSNPKQEERRENDLTSYSPAPASTKAVAIDDWDDVEILDMTSDDVPSQSSRTIPNPPQVVGRKRKSEEFEERSVEAIRDKRAAPRQVLQDIPDSEDEFPTLDDIQPEPAEPPPPYSTVAPRSPTKATPRLTVNRTETEVRYPDLRQPASTIEGNQQQPRSTEKAQASLTQNLASTPDIPISLSSEDDELLQKFVTLKADDLNSLVAKMETEYNAVIAVYLELLEDEYYQGDPDEKLKQADGFKANIDVLESLRAFVDRLGILEVEKRTVMARIKKLALARTAHQAERDQLDEIKKSVVQTRSECLPLLRQISPLLDTAEQSASIKPVQPASRTRKEDSDKPPAPRRATEAPQRAMPPPPSPKPRLTTVGHSPVRAGSRHQDDQSSRQIDNYFWSKRDKDKPSSKGKENYSFPMLIDEDFETDENLFEAVMGTPPAQRIEADEYFDDDFADDEEQLLEVERHIHAGTSSRRTGTTTTDRVPFAETSMNGPARQKTASARKSTDISNSALWNHPWSNEVKAALRSQFGLKGFRPNQLDSINATLGGKDVFVLMPTGGGKSLCYQLPAVIQSGKTRGVTVVVSPLLSLMEDQVSHLTKINIQAFVINGDTSKGEKDYIFGELWGSNPGAKIQLIYVTPEMLTKNQRMIDTFKRLNDNGQFARLVIDEAHCVSQWGHDFRPDYKAIGEIRSQFKGVPVIALTATATENVKVDVIHNLGITGCEVFSQSFNRPNLYYEVRSKGKATEQIDEIGNLITTKYRNKCGIIYCLSRKKCEQVAEELRKKCKIKAHHYHAQLKPEEKSEIQRRWQAGQYHVIVATIAFGMGIDKPDVRFVIHHSIPKSLEGYYQETGRAGRDGLRSSCYMYYGYQDTAVLKRMIMDGDGDYQQKERQIAMLRNMVQYCENKADCRRVQVLGYFSERFNKDECGGECDNCNSTSRFETKDFTAQAKLAVSLVQRFGRTDTVTLLQLVDILRGSKSKAVMNKGYDDYEEYGAASDLERGELERLLYRLITEDVLMEENVVNKAGFASQYIRPGRASRNINAGRQRIMMSVKMSPDGKSMAPPAKKPTKADAATKKIRSAARSEYPLSTNVSSPIQRTVKRKANGTNSHANGYEKDGFVLSDPEDDNFVNEDSDADSDGFAPIREAGSRRGTNKRPLGQPITVDEKLDALDEIHRDVLENFVQEAKAATQKIMSKRGLRNPPFTDTQLRLMAIEWPSTKAELMKLPDIDQFKVGTYGDQFLQMLNRYHDSLREMQRANIPVFDPNHREVVVIDSDEDEYGSVNDAPSDMGEEDDEEGGASQYFQRSQTQQQEIDEFNANIARVRSNGGPKRDVPDTTRERSTGAAARGRGSFRKNYRKTSAESTRSKTGAGVPKRRTSRKSADAGKSLERYVYNSDTRTATKRGNGGGGGIGMMPT